MFSTSSESLYLFYYEECDFGVLEPYSYVYLKQYLMGFLSYYYAEKAAASIFLSSAAEGFVLG